MALALLVSASVSGCAWGYAGREGRSASEPSPGQTTDAEMVTINHEDPPRQSEPKEEPKASSPCGLPTVDIYFYNPTTRVVKTLDCVERTVVNVLRTPIGQTAFQEARAANLPEDTWYVLVDPQGLRSNYLSNQNIVEMSQHFEVRFLGRDLTHDLLIYEFLDKEF
ncbi:MAG: hypothetical protein H0U74_04230 [Bradymonadaceae bacterium]|nr:hypothetical protein [Lujinxingiaceae bacterium]